MIAIIRIAGQVGLNKDIRETLNRLKIKRKYTCTIIKEKPDAILPTVGGQTSLDMAVQLYNAGVLKKYNIKLIGADISSIEKAENRELFKK